MTVRYKHELHVVRQNKIRYKMFRAESSSKARREAFFEFDFIFFLFLKIQFSFFLP